MPSRFDKLYRLTSPNFTKVSIPLLVAFRLAGEITPVRFGLWGLELTKCLHIETYEVLSNLRKCLS